MAAYHQILVALDLTQDSEAIAQQGALMAQALGARVQLLHVVEPIPVVAPVSPTAPPLLPDFVTEQRELLAAAEERLARLAEKLDLTSMTWTVQYGDTKSEILRAAREKHFDLIVLGARERHGLSVLVPFTEDTVLHNAPCDVLAVRIGRH